MNTSVYQLVGPNVTFTLVTLVGTELDIRVSDNELELERVPDPAWRPGPEEKLIEAKYPTLPGLKFLKNPMRLDA